MTVPHPLPPAMTLRDWFAGQYLAGNSLGGGDYWKTHARDAFEMADAMMRMRGDDLSDPTPDLLRELRKCRAQLAHVIGLLAPETAADAELRNENASAIEGADAAIAKAEGREIAP